METNNPDFSKEEFLKQTKRIIDSMQDEKANKEFQSIMKDSNFSEEDFRKTILEFDKNEEIKEVSFEEGLIHGMSIIDCENRNKLLTGNKIKELLNQKNASIYIDTIHLLVITHVRGLELPIPFFQVLPNDYLYYNLSIAIECPKTFETVRYEGEYRFLAYDDNNFDYRIEQVDCHYDLKTQQMITTTTNKY